MRRVVITGIGAVTPLANSFHDSWDMLKKGISGIRRITKFDASDSVWKMAGEIQDFNACLYMNVKETLRLDPFVHYAVSAAIMAVEDAGLLKKNSDELRVTSDKLKDQGSLLVTSHSLLNSAGVIIGSSRGGITTIEKELRKLYSSSCSKSQISNLKPRISPYLMPSTTIGMAASYAAQKLGIKGNCLGISNACASGANAIGEAFRLIRYGAADIILAGGAEAPICRFCVDGYGIAGALSKKSDISASRPFDIKRDGFVLAEGAAVLVLEEYGSALNRNAGIYGEIIGYSSTTDAFHITQPDVRGEINAILAALKDAGVQPEDVGYINTHGASTLLGDKAEAHAIKSVFKSGTQKIPVSSIKSMTGHMLAASGAFEAACTAMSLKQGIIPPTINLTEKDPDCSINVVTEKKEASLEFAVSNSFGFGGVNAVLALKTL